MKKAYTKPEIFFESFTASSALANNCEVPFNLAAQYVCGIPDENGVGLAIFDPSLGGSCVVPGTNDAKYDGFCYHIPEEAYNLFRS